MKPKPPSYYLHTQQGQSTCFLIAVLNKSKLQMFLKPDERLVHVTGPKNLIRF